MKKNDFLKKWAKHASGDRSVEEFERDVESVLAVTIRATTRGVANGIERAVGIPYSLKEERLLRAVVKEVIPAVERALMRLNGVEEEGEGGV